MTCNLYLGFANILVKSFTSEFPHVERYFWTLVNQPNFRKIIGQVKQAEAIPPVQSAKKPSQPKESKAKAKDEPKKEANKVPEKPKEEAEEEAPKPKPKNPLDLLPPSPMILDEWKRLYSNTKTNFREVAIKGIVFVAPRARCFTCFLNQEYDYMTIIIAKLVIMNLASKNFKKYI